MTAKPSNEVASDSAANHGAPPSTDTSRAKFLITSAAQVEGAAGSHYATVPVVINAVQSDGSRQRFTGTYTLRRSMVAGATPEQRAWHIYSAELIPSH